jgi:hypothetical protein
LLNISDQGEDIWDHRYLFSWEDSEAKTQLKIHTSRYQVTLVEMIVAEIKNEEVDNLHHTSKSVIVFHIIRFEDWQLSWGSSVSLKNSKAARIR